MTVEHHYNIRVTWTGNTGQGTAVVNGYSKNHEVQGKGKPVLLASSDPAFKGDPDRYNPEELLVAALSECHMLWYLSSCARAGVQVDSYVDNAEGTMVMNRDGSGQFSVVTLRPRIALADPAQRTVADAQHERAHHMCFIARSVNFPVNVEADYV